MAARLFAVIGKPELIDDPRFADNMARLRNNETLDVFIAAWIAEHTRDDVIQVLRDNEVPVGPVYNIADIRADPHAIARDMVIDVPDGDGRPALPMEGVFPKMSATPGAVRVAGRDMGADNDDIYRNRLGLSDDAIAALKEQGII